MSRWKLLDHWDRDLPGLTVGQLRERAAMAADYEARSVRPGTGRNPKAARESRQRRQAVEAELERRSDPHGVARPEVPFELHLAFVLLVGLGFSNAHLRSGTKEP